MRHIVSLVVFFAGGAVVALVFSARRDDHSSRAPTSPSVADRRIDALIDESEQIAALRARLDRIEGEIAALRAAAAAEANEPRLDPPAASSTEAEAPVLDEAALRKLKDDAVRGATESAERKAALETLARVAAESRDPQLRAEAWLEQGNIYFQAKDYRNAAEVLRRSVDEVGLAGETGQTACFELGWALCFSRDNAGAYEASRRVMDTPGLSKVMFANARWASAVFAAAKRDAEAARMLYEGMIADYGDDSDEYYRRIATMSKQGLAQLR